VISTFVL